MAQPVHQQRDASLAPRRVFGPALEAAFQLRSAFRDRNGDEEVLVLDPQEGIAPDGTIVTGIARSWVAAEFEPVITAAKAAMANRDEVSLYLYGSVATGQARTGCSDVDLLTVGLVTRAIHNEYGWA